MDKKNKIFCAIVAFTIPTLIMIALYWILGIFPFGNASVMTIDMNNQYIHFFSYLRQVLLGNHNLLYTFSKTLGGDMVGLSAYYLLSPLNFILLFFSVKWLPVAVEIITLLKIGLCGLVFFLSLSDESPSFSDLIFSTCYALSAYMLAYQQNIMWLDSVILLPLIALGIRRIIARKSPVTYIVALCFAIIFNYYIGFMICIFSVIYFLYNYFFRNRYNLIREWPILLSYGGSSILGGGLSMWLIIPMLHSLQGGKGALNFSLLTLDPFFHWSDFPVKIFVGAFDYEQVTMGLPNIYCGMIVLAFAGLFFLNKKISLIQKAGALGILLILFASFYFTAFNLIWHGFNPPAWFNYRFSFVFCFFMILLAREGFMESRHIPVRKIAIISSFVFLVISSLAFLMNRKPFGFMTTGKYLLSLGFVFIFLTGYILYIRLKKPYILIGMLFLCCIELFINGKYTLGTFYYADLKEYQSYIDKTEPAINYVKNLDNGFYRMEKTFHRAEDDPMLFDYRGLSHYSSSEKTQVKYFMGQTGFRNNGNWSIYATGSTYAMDSMLNVKYVLSEEELPFPYELLTTINDIYIYQNTCHLPIGYAASDRILTCSVDDSNPFQVQNDMWHAFIPSLAEDVFVEEAITKISTNNLEGPNADGFYIKQNSQSGAALAYTFTASTSNPVFAFFPSAEFHKVRITVNGKSLGNYYTTSEYNILRLGTFKEGTQVKVVMHLNEDLVNIRGNWFYYQDMDTFQKYYNAVSLAGFQVTSYTDSHLLGTVNNTQNGYTFFTIPYDEGWHVTMDGADVETYLAADTFLAVQTPAGEHTIELKYLPPGLILGTIVSIVSLLLTILWLARIYSKSKNN